MDYALLRADDMPELVVRLLESVEAEGPFGAKGLGESGVIPVSAAVANAVHDAIGVRFTELPITPARVRAALAARRRTVNAMSERDVIVRFSPTERALHWGFGLVYLSLLATGLPLMFPALRGWIRGYTPVVGFRLHLACAALWIVMTLAVVALGDRPRARPHLARADGVRARGPGLASVLPTLARHRRCRSGRHGQPGRSLQRRAEAQYMVRRDDLWDAPPHGPGAGADRAGSCRPLS